MRFRSLLAAILAVATVSATAFAVVRELKWTPDLVKANAGELSVNAKMGNDGLVHFEVTRNLARPWWVQAHLVVRSGKTRIVETHFPAIVPKGSATYSFEILPEYLDDSTFELAERWIDDERHPLPAPDGQDNVIRLRLFAPKAPAKKTASSAK